MTLNKQICICVFFSLVIVFSVLLIVIVINLRILMDNTYTKLDEKINDIYLDNLKDMAKETGATLNVHKQISEKSITKTLKLLVDLFNASTVSDYPLDWTGTSALPEQSTVTKTPDPLFSNLSTTYTQMTYVVPTGASSIDSVYLQKINVLNAIWERINYIMIGNESNINIGRTFIMINDTSATTKKKQILATIPGQEFKTVLTSDQFGSLPFYTEALSNKAKIVAIDKQADPFNGGLVDSLGFCQGYKINNLELVVGIFFTVKDLENLIAPLFSNDSSGKITKYIWNPRTEFIIDDQDNVISDSTLNFIITQPELLEKTILAREVTKSGDVYSIRNVTNKSNSGALYKLVTVLSPYNTNCTVVSLQEDGITVNSSSIDGCDYVVLLLQRNNVIEDFSFSLDDEIQNQFWILMTIIVSSSIMLCFLIGL